jgi:CHAD domain-containing protein
LCAQAQRVPNAQQIREVARALPEARDLDVVDITERAVVVSGLPDEEPRYYLQHALGFQMHDVRHPHHAQRHGRADIAWGKEATA